MSNVLVRDAQPGDVEAIWNLTRELAVFEHLEDQFVATVDDFHKELFGEDPAAKVIIAEIDGKLAGTALYFRTFSTFLGRSGIWLEDLFIHEEYRRHGVATKLMEELKRRSPGRLEWMVLDWNEDAIALYDHLGATQFTDAWTHYRIT
ncbi:unannotated protein [freshwater metagenome]|uniref:Unannotated protein n=1 Tax=freshwater metagenome TaxID=449393 RepID=A0A6J7Q646_9ZZZZ